MSFSDMLAGLTMLIVFPALLFLDILPVMFGSNSYLLVKTNGEKVGQMTSIIFKVYLPISVLCYSVIYFI